MTTGAEFSLLRLLRGRTDETAVLNAASQAKPLCAPDLPDRLAEAALRLRRAATANGLHLDYQSLAQAPAYAGYRAVAAELHSFDPRTLSTRGERLAFWINVFNALAVDAVVAFGLRGSIREAPGFFRRAAYAIGGVRFSAEQIEHGILRGNRPPLPRLPAPYEPGDPRLDLCVQPPDPRVHFALNCATRSCPMPRIYTATRIESELDAAAAAFVDGSVSVEAGRVTVSPLFQFYGDDFGGPSGVAALICRYLDDAAERAAVATAFAGGTVVYDAYDWNLNAP